MQPIEKGGDVLSVDQLADLKAQVQCQACLGILSDPTVAECSHAFCADCYRVCVNIQALQSRPLCPAPNCGQELMNGATDERLQELVVQFRKEEHKFRRQQESAQTPQPVKKLPLYYSLRCPRRIERNNNGQADFPEPRFPVAVRFPGAISKAPVRESCTQTLVAVSNAGVQADARAQVASSSSQTQPSCTAGVGVQAVVESQSQFVQANPSNTCSDTQTEQIATHGMETQTVEQITSTESVAVQTMPELVQKEKKKTPKKKGTSTAKQVKTKLKEVGVVELSDKGYSLRGRRVPGKANEIQPEEPKSYNLRKRKSSSVIDNQERSRTLSDARQQVEQTRKFGRQKKSATTILKKGVQRGLGPKKSQLKGQNEEINIFDNLASFISSQQGYA